MRITDVVTLASALAVFILCLGFAPEARAEWTWDADAGWINMGEPPAASDQGLYGYAAGLFTRGDYAAASEYFTKVGALFPDSPFAGKAQFGLARCEAHMGRPANSVRLCNELLMQKPAGVNLEEVVSFQLEQVRILSGRDPQRAEELLTPIVQGAPTPALLYEAILRQARVLLVAERFDDAREAALSAADRAYSETSRDEARLLAAMCDLIACRATQPSLVRLERAAALLRPLATSGRNDATTTTAQEYLSLTENALSDVDVRHMRVYMAATLLYQDRLDEARAIFKHARREFKNTLAGETASYYYAESLFRGRDHWGAFLAFQQFLKSYPATARLRRAVEREFRIGQTLGEQGSRRRAIAVMDAVTKDEPSGPLADDALMFIGRAQLDWRHYDEAKGTFDSLLKGYPRSEWASAALFFSGVADLNSADLAGDREVLLAQARGEFEVYLRNDPQGTFADAARKQLAATKERQAMGLVGIAGFYERRHEPKAAGVYYALVVGGFPDTAAVPQAQARLKALGAEGGAKP